MTNNRCIYWDSNVFLTHLNAVPNRTKTLIDLIQEIEDEKGYILTSSESIVEVAHALHEKQNGRLDPLVEEAIDAMWQNNNLIKMIDNGHHISTIARKLIRDVIPNNWVLKPKDAVHLASAFWYNKNVQAIEEFHTYDERLYKYETMIGMHICEPYAKQMRM